MAIGCKWPKCPSLDEWLGGIRHPSSGILLIIKRNKVLICTIMWMNFENIFLGEGSQLQKGTYYIIPCVYNIQNLQSQKFDLSMSRQGVENGK